MWLTWVPVAGVAVFVVLYLHAASLYPGGTQFDRLTRGYSHTSNYWCDLLDRVSRSGEPNPGRPFAVAATILLPLSLVPSWLQAPLLLRVGPVSRRIMQIAGTASMLLAALVFTPMHDLVINIGAVVGAITFVALAVGLARARRTALFGAALVPVGFGVANYLMWQTGFLLQAMPVVQRAAYASSFLWIIAASSAIRRELSTP
jgi:hypothetical protein